jgi:hypothetical protein
MVLGFRDILAGSLKLRRLKSGRPYCRKNFRN